MSQPQKQKKQKRLKITNQQLYNKFKQADINNDDKLSASQITLLLQNLGYNDTYKGTIKKICRKLQQVKQNKPRKFISQSQVSKQLDSQQKEQQPQIDFEQFSTYFDILEDPISKQIYKIDLNRKALIIQTSKQLKERQIFHNEKGQKINVNLLIGQSKEKYNSSIQLKINKQLNNQKIPKNYILELFISTKSQQHGNCIAQPLKNLLNFLHQIAQGQGQYATKFLQKFKFQIQSIGKLVKIKVTILDAFFEQFLSNMTELLDDILNIQLAVLLSFFIRFDFNLIDLKNNPNSVIEQIILKNCHINFSYQGSEFMNSIKQLGLIHDLWKIIRDNGFSSDSAMSFFYSLLMLQQVDIDLKYKNLLQITNTRQITNSILQGLRMVNQIPLQLFNYRKFAESIQGPVKLNIQIKNTQVQLEINVKDLFNLPIMFDNDQNYDSD